MQVTERPPSGENDKAALVAQPVASGLRAVTPIEALRNAGFKQRSNLDASGKPVKKGVIVSHCMRHFLVAKVRTGSFIAYPLDPFGRAKSSFLLLDCSDVHVICSKQFYPTSYAHQVQAKA